MLTIGLSGKAGSGKDTVANFIVEYANEHDLEIERFAYADAVKQSVDVIDPFIPDDTGMFVRFSEYFKSIQQRINNTNWRSTWDIAKINPEVRRLIQKVGTEAGRDIHGHNTWINIAQKRVKTAHDDGVELLIITDVRFPNEQEDIHSYRQYGQAQNVCVIRPSLEAERNAHLGNNSTHASETSLDSSLVDDFIINDGSLDHLKGAVYESLDQWLDETE